MTGRGKTGFPPSMGGKGVAHASGTRGQAKRHRYVDLALAAVVQRGLNVFANCFFFL